MTLQLFNIVWEIVCILLNNQYFRAMTIQENVIKIITYYIILYPVTRSADMEFWVSPVHCIHQDSISVSRLPIPVTTIQRCNVKECFWYTPVAFNRWFPSKIIAKIQQNGGFIKIFETLYYQLQEVLWM